jgi:hypothetical protein
MKNDYIKELLDKERFIAQQEKQLKKKTKQLKF